MNTIITPYMFFKHAVNRKVKRVGYALDFLLDLLIVIIIKKLIQQYNRQFLSSSKTVTSETPVTVYLNSNPCISNLAYH